MRSKVSYVEEGCGIPGRSTIGIKFCEICEEFVELEKARDCYCVRDWRELGFEWWSGR